MHINKARSKSSTINESNLLRIMDIKRNKSKITFKDRYVKKIIRTENIKDFFSFVREIFNYCGHYLLNKGNFDNWKARSNQLDSIFIQLCK